MELANLMDKVLGGVEKHATLLGGVAGALSYGTENLINNVQAILGGHGHFPDIPFTLQELIAPNSQNRKILETSIAGYIAGYAMKEMKILPQVGNIVQKASIGYFAGNAVQHVLYMSTHASGGSYPAGDPRYNANKAETPATYMNYPAEIGSGDA